MEQEYLSAMHIKDIKTSFLKEVLKKYGTMKLGEAYSRKYILTII